MRWRNSGAPDQNDILGLPGADRLELHEVPHHQHISTGFRGKEGELRAPICADNPSANPTDAQGTYGSMHGITL